MVWYSHVYKSFLQFVMIITVKGFSIVNETEVEVFLEFFCFLYDPANLIFTCIILNTGYSKDTRHTGLRVYATSSMNSSRLMASAETLLSYQRSHSQVLRLKNLKI